MNEEMNTQQKQNNQKKASVYMTVGVCVIALVLGVWSALTGTQSDNQAKATTTTLATSVSEPAKAAENKVTGVTAKTISQTTTEKTQKAAEKTTAKQNTVASYFIMPIGGETVKKYSAAELQYSETYGDWRLHTAIDIKADEDTPVNASGDGKVTDIYEDSNYGKVVVIDHGNGIIGYYCGLTKLGVQKGDIVAAGDKIGMAGTVPCEARDGVQLHFEVKQNDKYIDPLQLIKAE